jgi:multiple sugar transport system substrate-binding protein
MDSTRKTPACPTSTAQPNHHRGLVNQQAAKHFEEAGLDPDKPPTTWDELLEYARTLTTGGRYGIGLFGKGDGSSVWRFAYWWMTNGANVLDADGNVTVNTPEFIEAMRFWKSLYDEHQVAPPSVPQNSFSENNALFASGVVSMVQSGVWQFGVAYDMNPDLRGHVRAALMPVAEVPVAAGGGDDGIAITTACQHPEEAYRLLKFLSSAEAGRVLWDIQGKFPANLSALDTPEYEDDALVQQWASILPHTRAAVLHERYPEISEVLGVMQQEILLGVKPIEAAVADADRAIRDIVER